MKHDYRTDPSSEKAAAFLDWLCTTTIECLRRDHGNLEATIGSVFLYVNRAYEAGLPDDKVGGLFGKCAARAGYTDEETDAVITLLEQQSDIAKKVHNVSADQGDR